MGVFFVTWQGEYVDWQGRGAPLKSGLILCKTSLLGKINNLTAIRVLRPLTELVLKESFVRQ